MYSNVVLNVFNNPKNAGRISKPDGIADCYNFDNTAHVEFSLRIESGVITDCKFRAQANPYIIAICSTITTMVKGKMCTLVFLDPYSVKAALGDESEYDIMFCLDCLKMALDDFKEKLIKAQKDSKKEDDIKKSAEESNPTPVQSEEEQPSDPDDDFDFSDFFEEI